MMPLTRVISGGQSGVDRAALDTAAALGLSIGGWCPRGRRAADGPIPAIYPLHETPSADYSQRTRWNVRDSDATLILTPGALTGGTAFTQRQAEHQGHPWYVVDLTGPAPIAPIHRWLMDHQATVLNVAGPRENQHPGIYNQACTFLHQLLTSVG